MKKVVMAISVLFLALGACTKKREDSFAQGQGGEGLKTVSDFDGRTFEIQTGKAKGQVYTSKAGDVEIKDGLEVNHMPLVDYTTEAKLLDNVPFRGRETFKYKAIYHLTDSHLVVYKVGDKIDIPIEERASAETDLVKGKLAVPMIGYPIKGFYKVEKQLNGDGETTNTLLEIPVDGKAKATHFRIDLNMGEIFKPLQKIDVFPANIFDGSEWYYAETVIKAQEKETIWLGQLMSYDAKLDNSTRIKFQKFDSSITGLNSNVDDRIKDDKDQSNASNVVSIPVRWKAYKKIKRGNSFQMTEEEDDTIPWKERPFVEMDLEKISSNGVPKITMKVMDIKIADDYFSFSLFDTETKLKTRYSFRKVVKTDYPVRNYSRDDEKNFGFFYTEKDHLRTTEVYSQADVEKNRFLARFHPEKPIVYHFTKTTPDWIRPACKEVVASWSQAFAIAGSKATVEISDEDVDLGDIRYNALNMIETVAGTNLFGVGPSLAEPTTGEIISAITNVHLTSIVEEAAEEVRHFINREIGMYNGQWIFSSGYEKNPLKHIAGLQLADIANMKLPDQPLKLGFFENDIPKLCPEVLTYAAKVKGEFLRDGESEAQVLLPCARKLAIPKIQSTLVHEMGHNFGLRHNFYASTDKRNFLEVEKTKTDTQVQSSSVMEYPDFDADRLIVPGYYDIAAIRFGYANKVEVCDSGSDCKERATAKIKIVGVDSRKSLKQQGVEAQLVPYKFCTDETADENPLKLRRPQPLCNRHDKGTNASEVVDHYIEIYNKFYLYYNLRFGKFLDKNRNSVILSQVKTDRIFSHLNDIYGKWREYVVFIVGKDDRNLERFDVNTYNSKLESVKNDPRYSAIFKDYREAADKIYQFYKAVAFTLPKYCIARAADQSIRFLTMSDLRADIFRDLGKEVHECFDPITVSYLGNMNLKLEHGGGFFNEDIRYTFNEKDATDLADIYGNAFDKNYAVNTLSVRDTVSTLMVVENFYPIVLDEPQYRQDYANAVMDRLLNGIPLKDVGINDSRYIKKFNVNPFAAGDDIEVKRYKALSQARKMIDTSLEAGAIWENNFLVESYIEKTSTDEVGDIKVTIAGEKFYAHKRALYAYQILSKINELQALQLKGEIAIKKAGYETVKDLADHLDILVKCISNK